MDVVASIWQRVVDAHVRLISPTTAIDAGHFTALGICLAVSFLVVAVFHRVVAARFERQYFVCHVFVNAIICALTWRGALEALMNPSASTVPTGSTASPTWYLCWIYALHVYHVIAFQTNSMDWVHHIPLYILNTLMFATMAGTVFPLQAFILTGAPGGLDYLLLVLEGEGYLGRARYKHLSGNINNWVRGPLGFISGYICLIGLYHQWQHVTSWFQVATMVLMGVHAMWNAPFFGRQAIEANIVDTINRFGMQGSTEKGKTIRLPKVRVLSGKLPKKEHTQ